LEFCRLPLRHQSAPGSPWSALRHRVLLVDLGNLGTDLWVHQSFTRRWRTTIHLSSGITSAIKVTRTTRWRRPSLIPLVRLRIMSDGELSGNLRNRKKLRTRSGTKTKNNSEESVTVLVTEGSYENGMVTKYKFSDRCLIRAPSRHLYPRLHGPRPAHDLQVGIPNSAQAHMSQPLGWSLSLPISAIVGRPIVRALFFLTMCLHTNATPTFVTRRKNHSTSLTHK
jgi:hypothetical protein